MDYRLIAGGFTDKGSVRKENQDSFYKHIGEQMSVFCVADGMGGHTQGGRASIVVTDSVREWTDNFYEGKYEDGFQGILEDFEQCLLKASRQIFQFYNKGQICGTTVVALLIYEKYYAVFSVGDSRLYRKRGVSFAQMTKDDNWQNSDAVPDKYSNKEIKGHQNYGKLVKALGVCDTVVPFRVTDRLKWGDAFFLCSDGVYQYCSVDIIRRCCQRAIWKPEKTIEAGLDDICRCVKLKGAPDNLTAVLVQVGGWRGKQ